MSKIAVILLLVCLIYSVKSQFYERCRYDSDCGGFKRCVGGYCQTNSDECFKTIDCRYKGLYLKCKGRRCVKSDHKICLTDQDCKKNVLNRKCKEDNNCGLPFIG